LQVLALALKALFEVVRCYKAIVVAVEVMESEPEVRLYERFAPIDCHGQELRVVDLTIVVQVDVLEDGLDLVRTQLDGCQRVLDFHQTECA